MLLDHSLFRLTQKGEITTVEGILSRTIAGLEQDQPVRKYMDPDGFEKIDTFVGKFKENLLNAEKG